MHAALLGEKAVLLKSLAAVQFDGPAEAFLLIEKPAPGVHVCVAEVSVVEGLGFENDHPRKSYYRGVMMPGRQVSAITREFCLAANLDPVVVGDNLVTSGVNLAAIKPGMRIQIGPDAVLERTAVPHKPCSLFIERAGRAAYDVARENNWRGALFDVVNGGRVNVGDAIVLLTKEGAVL